MNRRELQADLMARFGISPVEADKAIDEMEAKTAVRASVAAATRGVPVVAQDLDLDNPQIWRHEIHKRLAALDVLEEGLECLGHLQEHIGQIVEAEQKLIQSKRAKVRDKQCAWWDFRDSGWAMGGRERFATYVGDLFRNLDEGQLGGRVMDRMGFKRPIPLPDIPEPVIEEVPADAEKLEASLVKAAQPPYGSKRNLPSPSLDSLKQNPMLKGGLKDDLNTLEELAQHKMKVGEKEAALVLRQIRRAVEMKQGKQAKPLLKKLSPSQTMLIPQSVMKALGGYRVKGFKNEKLVMSDKLLTALQRYDWPGKVEFKRQNDGQFKMTGHPSSKVDGGTWGAWSAAGETFLVLKKGGQEWDADLHRPFGVSEFQRAIKDILQSV